MSRFGFIVTAALVFALTTRAFGSRRILLDLAIGLFIAGLAWFGFSFLGVNLGEGWRMPKSVIELIPSPKPW
jgi:putative tricarboxylic transport membrane protein